MNQYIISIGTNLQPIRNLESAQHLLKNLFPTIVFGEPHETSPFGISKDVPNFFNQIAFFSTLLPLKEVELKLKEIEIFLGRNKDDKQKGLIPIDLDILKFNNTIIRTNDWERPYIQELIKAFQKQYPNS